MTEGLYAALIGAEGGEPGAETGYARVAVTGETVVFPQAEGGGYGLLGGYALYHCPHGGEPVEVHLREKPIAAFAGTVPVISGGRLLVGMDVSARVGVATVAQAKEG